MKNTIIRLICIIIILCGAVAWFGYGDHRMRAWKRIGDLHSRGLVTDWTYVRYGIFAHAHIFGAVVLACVTIALWVKYILKNRKAS